MDRHNNDNLAIVIIFTGSASAVMILILILIICHCFVKKKDSRNNTRNYSTTKNSYFDRQQTSDDNGEYFSYCFEDTYYPNEDEECEIDDNYHQTSSPVAVETIVNANREIKIKSSEPHVKLKIFKTDLSNNFNNTFNENNNNNQSINFQTKSDNSSDSSNNTGNNNNNSNDNVLKYQLNNENNNDEKTNFNRKSSINSNVQSDKKDVIKMSKARKSSLDHGLELVLVRQESFDEPESYSFTETTKDHLETRDDEKDFLTDDDDNRSSSEITKKQYEELWELRATFEAEEKEEEKVKDDEEESNLNEFDNNLDKNSDDNNNSSENKNLIENEDDEKMFTRNESKLSKNDSGYRSIERRDYSIDYKSEKIFRQFISTSISKKSPHQSIEEEQETTTDVTFV